VKFRCASDLFTKKQAADESVDAFITKMRKLARLWYAVINGLKPYISAQVTRAQPKSVDKVLDVARLAELAMSKVDPTTVESTVCQQLVEMQAEMQRLSTKVDKAMTTSIAPRSPTPEWRVHFTRDESPAPRTTALMRLSRQVGRSDADTCRPPVI
jgi:aspartyl/asparaginyl-tRNA synthetase